MPLFVRRADAIIAVSTHTKSDLIRLYGTPGDKISVIHEGIDPDFQPAADYEVRRVSNRYSPGKPYLLMVGTLEPRKNHETALRALAMLAARDYPHHLLIAGPKGWLFEPVRRLITQLGLQQLVRFTGFVPAEDLVPLYTGAACVLHPTLYEGFGFPVLEAMACSAPVVCSNTSSLPEIAGNAATLVPPTDAAALARAVQHILDNRELAQSLRDRGVRQAAKFRWDTTAIRTLELYSRLAAQERTHSGAPRS
jgi:glycosyltransferase involved in cell wall biosynthesis